MIPILNLANNWWTFLIRGICAILFGVIAITNPAVAGLTLITFFGAFVLVDGIFSLVAAICGRGKDNPVTPTWWLVLVGLCGIAAGIIAFAGPGFVGITLIYCIAFWALARGFFEIFGSMSLPKGTEGKGWFIFSGAMSVIFGVLVFWNPFAGGQAVLWVIGFYAIVLGAMMIPFSLRLKKLKPENIKKTIEEKYRA